MPIYLNFMINGSITPSLWDFCIQVNFGATITPCRWHLGNWQSWRAATRNPVEKLRYE